MKAFGFRKIGIWFTTSFPYSFWNQNRTDTQRHKISKSIKSEGFNKAGTLRNKIWCLQSSMRDINRLKTPIASLQLKINRFVSKCHVALQQISLHLGFVLVENHLLCPIIPNVPKLALLCLTKKTKAFKKSFKGCERLSFTKVSLVKTPFALSKFSWSVWIDLARYGFARLRNIIVEGVLR